MAAVQSGNPETLEGVVRRQRAHLLRELHSLTEARRQAPSAVVELLITAAELHIRADLGVVDAAERNLEPELAGLQASSSGPGSTGAAAADAAAPDPAAPDPAAAGTARSAGRAKSAGG